jgi:HlyD family secretion protein
MANDTSDKPEQKKIPFKKILIIIALLALIGLAVKYFFFSGPFRYAGTLEGTKVDLSARLSAAIETVNVREGDHVKINQLLVKLGCEDYKAADEIASINYDRNQKLRKEGTVSQEVLDQMKNTKQVSNIHVDWCTISSPIDGIVLSRIHEPGEWVNPGVKLLTLENIQDIWAFIYVPQPEVAYLKPGQKLRGFLPEMNNREFSGTILKINSEAEFTPKNVQTRAERTRLVFGVKVSFLGSNDDETLKPGMTIEMEVPEHQ